MITLERTVRTAAPRERVFAYLADFTTTTEWDPGSVSTTRESGDGGPGTTYHNVSRFAGRETELTYVTQQVRSPELLQLRGTNKTVTATDTMTLREVDGGTEVHYRADFEFNGIARFLEPLLRIPMKKLGDDAAKGMTSALGKLQ